MSHDFSHSVDRTGSRAEKWDRGNIAGICGNADALPFWVADMDLRVSSDISAAMHREADLGVYGYRDSGALKGLFINFMRERHREMWTVVGSAAEVLPAIRHAKTWDTGYRKFAAI